MNSFNPRAALTTLMQDLARSGLNQGAAGNASARVATGMLITPTGVRPFALCDAQHVEMNLAGAAGATRYLPSSEWRLHSDIYRTYPEVNAVVHVHSPYATALACLRREIPAFHYMVAVGGGASIRCAPYATFGTQALSDHVLEALVGRRACLLANHGLVAIGPTLQAAYELTLAIEDLAQQYCVALQAGEPVLLTASEMHEVLERFKTYGQQPE